MRLIVALLAVTTPAYAAPSVDCVLDKSVREQVLDFHNRKREDLAKGRLGNLGPAKNMYKLEWSCRLERLAKKYSQQCLDRPDKFMGLGSYGASLVYVDIDYIPDLAVVKHVTERALDAWWKPAEGSRLRPDNRYPGGAFSTAANIINSETTQVGCSYSLCPVVGKPKKMGLLCLYDDVAYMTNRVLYDSGDYCKKKEDCTTYRGSTCDTKTGLCVKPEDTANDHESKMCKVGSGMTDKVRNTFLNLHNDIRSLVASGKAEDKLIKDGKGFAPKAANMRKLEYNCGLEEMAAKYARKCLYTHSSTESRMTSEGEAGENLFTITISDGVQQSRSATRAWFRELKDNGVGEDNILTRELLDRSKTEAFKDRRIGH
ncbi:hypothetical protein Aduo_000306 [Ancylostoma duodenale]